jgi:soluble lytic murein transglycosylase-like protein
MMWPNEKAYDKIVDGMAIGAGVHAPLIKAIIARESGFRPNVERYEKLVKDRTVNGKPAPGPDTSRGLMQVLEFRAREMGYTGSAEHLKEPSINIRYGTELLRRNIERAGGNIAVAVSAYNAGWSKVRPNDAKRDAHGRFVNQAYVDDVNLYAAYFAGKLTADQVRQARSGPLAAMPSAAGLFF